MQIIKIYPKGFGSNAYIITKDGQNAIVIDPSTPRVFDEVTKRGLTAQFVLLTHFHFDHTAGVEIFQTNGAKLEQSLARLSRLDDWKIYPGHGEESSIYEEIKNNPFMVFKE